MLVLCLSPQIEVTFGETDFNALEVKGSPFFFTAWAKKIYLLITSANNLYIIEPESLKKVS